jgi:glycosyltransferase involved in cell wall biosynthesis
MARNLNPLISIGMPVHNEEKHIADAINSIIAQSYENFELIISDNASTDGTKRICTEYAMKDTRIRYHRNEENIGSTNNFNRVFSLSKGEYFTWASGHDKRAKDSLSESLLKLFSNKNAVLCYSDANWLDANGNIIGLIHYSFDSYDDDKKKRFRNVLLGVSEYASPIYGIYRSEALRKTGMLKKIFAGDVLLLCELSLLGPFIYIENPLLEIRQMPDFGVLSSYLKKLFGKNFTKSKAVKEFYITIMEFFSLIDNNFKDFSSRLYLKGVTLFFFLFIQRGYLLAVGFPRFFDK